MAAVPTISVVIPCYNADKYITATIRSVLLQNWPSLEIIVVDDGSKDNSVRVVSDTFPFVRLVRQANQGVAAARNNGIAQCSGEWIALIDADDIWLEGKLAKQWALLQANPGVRMSCTAWQMWQCVDPEPAEAFVKQVQSQAFETATGAGPSGWIYPDLLAACCVWTSTVLAHRSVFEEVGQFDATLRIGEDYDFWLRASRVTQIVRVPQPLALYRRHAASLTKAAPAKNWEVIVVQSALCRWGLTSPVGTSAKLETVSKHLARTWSDFAGANLIAGQRQRALIASIKSIRTSWQQMQGWKVLLKTALNYP